MGVVARVRDRRGNGDRHRPTEQDETEQLSQPEEDRHVRGEEGKAVDTGEIGQR